MIDDQKFDFSPVLRRLLPPGALEVLGPVHDVMAFLEARFGRPETTAETPALRTTTFKQGDVGVSALVDIRSARIVGLTALAFGLPLPFTKACPSTALRVTWVTGTAQESFVPLIGSLVATTATATALALLDYYQKVAALNLCGGLCTPPCWCNITQNLLTPTVTVAPLREIFGIPVLIGVTVSFSGWVIPWCEGWNF